MLSLVTALITCFQVQAADWTIDSVDDWARSIETAEGATVAEGSVSSDTKTATVTTKLHSLDQKRSAKSLVVTQSAIWQNWNPIENLGPSNLADAPVLLTVGPDNYWMFGRYGGQRRPKKGPSEAAQAKFQPQAATLDGFDLSNLPAGFGFKVQLRLTDTTENKSKPIVERMTLTFAD